MGNISLPRNFQGTHDPFAAESIRIRVKSMTDIENELKKAGFAVSLRFDRVHNTRPSAEFSFTNVADHEAFVESNWYPEARETARRNSFELETRLMKAER